jgi:hypothetical protein
MWVNKYDVSIDMWAKQYDVAIDMWASLVHVRHIRTHIQQSKQFNIFYYSNTTDIGKSSEEYSWFTIFHQILFLPSHMHIIFGTQFHTTYFNTWQTRHLPRGYLSLNMISGVVFICASLQMLWHRAW